MSPHSMFVRQIDFRVKGMLIPGNQHEFVFRQKTHCDFRPKHGFQRRLSWETRIGDFSSVEMA